ncbi:MAG: phospho-sugar mutase [Chlamydiia bacterium]|nr:phospho-sugar mutase [Chlamydiia bacterium]
MLDEEAEKNIQSWLAQEYDDKTKDTIRQMLNADDPELNNAFYTNLAFGTGGMRGIMGVGTNRMNRYTIMRATQGLANYIEEENLPNPSVLIGYDSRHHSREFAEIAARVLAANEIDVYIASDIRPTPWVSFGCRFKRCNAAIMITASHNPPEYNGYKVYWSDGAQVLPPHDKGIIEDVNKIESLSEIKKTDLKSPFITWIDEEIDNAYLKAIRPLSLCPDQNKTKGENLKVLYSSLHGTGIKLLPKAMQDWGFSNLTLVEKQCIPDGDFSAAPSPNPEDPEALKMGVEQLLKENLDLLIATDPDADRVGAVVNHQGKAVYLNGNQIACLGLYHILSEKKVQNTLPDNGAAIKTIVTTELFKKIANNFGVTCFNVHTGFKYVAEKIREWEEDSNPYQYLFGGEESFGYLWGTYARDKDGISASLLIQEIALKQKLKGKTLIDLLNEIYERYGLFFETLKSVRFEETKEGKEKMAQSLDKLRNSPPKSLADIAVKTLDDYQKRKRFDLLSGHVTELPLAQSNVLIFWLEDDSKVMVRPSGTEPKVKLYCGVSQSTFSNQEEALQTLKSKANTLINALESHLQ